MVAQVRPKTYDKKVGGIVTIGTVTVIDDINPTLLNHFIGIRYFSDATGATEVTPTAGEVHVEAMDDVISMWVPVQDEPIQATDPTLKASYAGNISAVRATPSGITVATHYQLVVVSNLEGSTSDAWLVEAMETSDRGNTALGVFVQDQTTNPLDIFFLQALNQTTIAAPTAVDSYTFTATAGHGIIVGDIIEIANEDNFIQATAIGVLGDVITLDAPINHAYIAGADLFVSNADMRVDGSVTPQIFSILPGPLQKGDMVRVILGIQSTAAMDFSKFGSNTALTRGCLLRVRKSDGDFTNLFNWKTNGEFILRSFDHAFQIKSGGGLHSFVSRSTYGSASKRGVVIRLNGAIGEQLQVVIQDDNTAGLSSFTMIAQGHEVQDSV